MYKYHNFIKRTKRRSSVIIALEDIIAFVFPVVGTWLYGILDIKPDWGSIYFWVAIISAGLYILYLIYRVVTVYKISNDKREVYRKQFIEQVDSVILDKYKMLCSEIHHSSRQEKDVLLYDAHAVINDILAHIKQLIANITGVSLDNISVNFVYKYNGEGEHWQTIDGSSSCSIGQLDDIVEKKESMYHHLYANNREYVFYNDKARADWHMYRASIRDGEDKRSWGSIYCKRILCTMHQDRFVDGILAISTYNEKFTTSKRKAAINEIEDLINEAILVFTNLIKSEMASLYIRHEYIKRKQFESIDLLIDSGIIESHDQDGEKRNPRNMTEEERLKHLQVALPKFKLVYNKLFPHFFQFDTLYDHKTETVLQYYAAYQKMKANEDNEESKE